MSDIEGAWAPGTPCWVDMSVADLPGAQRFYGDALGWTMVDSGEEYGHYTIAQVDGRPVAGIGPVMPGGGPSPWTLYFASADVERTAALVTEHGGQILAGPMDISAGGRMAVALDPLGALLGLWQATGMAGFAPATAAGGVMWEDGRSSDTELARRFYGAVFGHTFSEVPGVPMAQYGTFDVAGRPAGGLGAMMGEPEDTEPFWLTYFGVPDVDAAVTAVSAGGGTVTRPALDTPFGRMAQVVDPAGAPFALITAAAPA